MLNPMDLTPQQEKFAVGCVELCNQSAAYRQAYDCGGSNFRTITEEASKLAALPHVAARIQQLRDAAAERRAIPALEERIKEQRELEQADPTEIIGLHWDCCRYCYGLDHHYQWTDEHEYAKAFDHAVNNGDKVMPDMFGGFGFNQNRPPVSSCTQCWGVGISRPYITDTRTLSARARRLYKGIKVKSDGSFEVLLYDQQKATDMLNRIQGAYKDGVKEQPPVPGAATQQAAAAKTSEELQRSYLRLVSG